jgi:NAD-dependent SIR2 family protein deacetylase
MTRTDGEASEAIRRADALLITAGAGMGVDSGLPDFRGNEGFWEAYPVVAKLGLSFAEMANPGWFRLDPALAWAFYGHRLNLYRKIKPHAGFGVLLRWAKEKRDGYFVFTSNVDGHFQKAGFDPARVEECHGSIHYLQCVDACTEEIWDGVGEQVVVDEETFRAAPPLPRCSRCGGLARPNVLMFCDHTWVAERNRRQRGRFEEWLRRLEQNRSRLVAIELGAGTAIPTVRHLSETVVSRLNGTLIRINPRDFAVPSGHFGLAAGAREGIERLIQAGSRPEGIN